MHWSTWSKLHICPKYYLLTVLYYSPYCTHYTQVQSLPLHLLLTAFSYCYPMHTHMFTAPHHTTHHRIKKYCTYKYMICILVQPPCRRGGVIFKDVIKIDIWFWFYKPWRKWLKDSLEKRKHWYITNLSIPNEYP